MELKMTECNGLSDSELFMRTICEWDNLFAYINRLLNLDEYELASNDIDDLFIPMDFFLSFGGKTYVIVRDSEFTDQAFDVLDAMSAYAKDFHTFDFIQDSIKIDVDIFERELAIEIEEK